MIRGPEVPSSFGGAYRAGIKVLGLGQGLLQHVLIHQPGWISEHFEAALGPINALPPLLCCKLAMLTGPCREFRLTCTAFPPSIHGERNGIYLRLD